MGCPVFFTSFRKKPHLLLALLASMIASLGIMGWLFHSTTLIQLRPDFAPMVMNTAVSILLLTAALFISESRYSRLSIYPALLVLLHGLLNLLQYATGQDLGIDRIFLNPFYSVGVSAPGRMAISTTMCFIFLSIAACLRGTTRNYRIPRITLSTLVLAFAVLNCLGYFLNFSAEYGWGGFARMAMHTAVCFILLSLTHLWQVHNILNRLDPERRAIIAMYVLVVGVFVSGVIWQLLLLKDIERNRSITQSRAESFRADLDGVLIHMERTLKHMAIRIVEQAYKDEDYWLMDARFHHKEFGSLRHILWADADRRIRWIYPLDNFAESIRQKKLGQSAEVSRALDDLNNGAKSLITSTFQLKDGKPTAIMLVPIFRGPEMLGILASAIEVKKLFEPMANRYEYQASVYEGDKVLYSAGPVDPVVSRDWRVSLPYTRLGAKWTIEITPSTDVIRSNISSMPMVVLTFGVCLSILSAYALSFHYHSNLLRRRAREISDWKTAAMDATPLMILSLDRQGVVREMNSSAEQMTGWKSEELEGRFIPEVMHEAREVKQFRDKMEKDLGRPLPSNVDFIEAMFDLGYNMATEWCFIGKQGQRFFGTVSLGRILGEHGLCTGYLVVVEDVTQKKEKERLLKEQELKIITSSRLASLGEMAAGIAHEINNPLTIINGHVSALRRLLAQRGLESDADVVRKTDKIEQTVNRIAKIVRGLRTYARESDQGDKEWVRLDTLVEDTLSFCADRFKREDIELDVQLTENVQVFCRSFQITQVLLNLLNNAADAVQHSEVRKVVVSTQLRDQGVEISVADTGPGISPDLREKIMEPFFTTKEVGKGVGLGLSISQGIVQAHDGRFSLDTSVEGTRFVVWLPQVKHLEVGK